MLIDVTYSFLGTNTSISLHHYLMKLLWEENAVKLLGILIDSNIKFNDHLKIICKNATQKLTAIFRFCQILSDERRNILSQTVANLNLTIAY